MIVHALVTSVLTPWRPSRLGCARSSTGYRTRERPGGTWWYAHSSPARRGPDVAPPWHEAHPAVGTRHRGRRGGGRRRRGGGQGRGPVPGCCAHRAPVAARRRRRGHPGHQTALSRRADSRPERAGRPGGAWPGGGGRSRRVRPEGHLPGEPGERDPGRVQRPDPGLTQHEIEVLRGVARGLSDKEIAAQLFLSESTVKSRLRYVYLKLGLRNRAHAAVFVLKKGLLAAASGPHRSAASSGPPLAAPPGRPAARSAGTPAGARAGRS